MTILRALGATPSKLAGMIMMETALISVVSISLAIGLVRLLTWGTADIVSQWAGIRIELSWIAAYELLTLWIIVAAGLIASLIPASMVYKRSLHQGFSS